MSTSSTQMLKKFTSTKSWLKRDSPRKRITQWIIHGISRLKWNLILIRWWDFPAKFPNWINRLRYITRCFHFGRTLDVVTLLIIAWRSWKEEHWVTQRPLRHATSFWVGVCNAMVNKPQTSGQRAKYMLFYTCSRWETRMNCIQKAISLHGTRGEDSDVKGAGMFVFPCSGVNYGFWIL